MSDNRTPAQRRTLPPTLITLALGACLMAGTAHAAPGAPAHAAAFADGWRQARVEALLQGHATVGGHIHKDCRTGGGHGEASANASHVLASYSFGGNPNLRRHIVVPLADGSGLQAGDVIRVNVRSCLPAVR